MKKSNFQFKQPYLEELHFVEYEDFIFEESKIEMDNAFRTIIKKRKDSNMAKVSLILNVNPENNNIPFKLEIKVSANFTWKNLDDEEADNMLKINAPSLLLGYMRPIVANVTNSSQFPVYNLPFINFIE